MSDWEAPESGWYQWGNAPRKLSDAEVAERWGPTHCRYMTTIEGLDTACPYYLMTCDDCGHSMAQLTPFLAEQSMPHYHQRKSDGMLCMVAGGVEVPIRSHNVPATAEHGE